MNKIILGIDATSIKSGGGITHLVEIINNFSNKDYYFKKIIIWSSTKILKKINNKNYIIKKNIKFLSSNFIYNFFWKFFFLKRHIKLEKCNLLFIPSGSQIGGFKPTIVMSQNMLPFEFKEIKRYGFSISFLKLIIMRYITILTFKKSSGIIFLNNYAKNKIISKISNFSTPNIIIPHGISKRFFNKNFNIDKLNAVKDFTNIIYVSSIEPYKHHDKVISAISLLNKNKYKVKLNIYGEGNKKNVKKLNRLIKSSGIADIKYYGNYAYENLHKELFKYDIAIFASSCENMPNILLEYMAANLPIACNNKEPMKSILKDSALFFDVNNINSICDCLVSYINSPSTRLEKSKKANNLSMEYSWEYTSNQTFKFLYETFNKYHST